MHVDYYMPEEERDELLEKFENDEYAQYEKRLKVREDAEFVLESLGLIRKDLMCLNNNEDAVDLHQDMAGITRILEVFGLPLDDSVANEPTEINLSDWANLCTFRVIIMRRNITTAKIFVEKTLQPLEICKIESLLHCLRNFLEIGDIDEYEMEMLETDDYYNASFLKDQSSIEMLYSAPSVKPPPPREVSDDEEEDEEEEEEEKEDEEEEEKDEVEEEDEAKASGEGSEAAYDDDGADNEGGDGEKKKKKTDASGEEGSAKGSGDEAKADSEGSEKKRKKSSMGSSSERSSSRSSKSRSGSSTPRKKRSASHKSPARKKGASSSVDSSEKVTRSHSLRESTGSASGSEDSSPTVSVTSPTTPERKLNPAAAFAKSKRGRSGSSMMRLGAVIKKKKKKVVMLAPMDGGDYKRDKKMQREQSVKAFQDRRQARKARNTNKATLTLEDIKQKNKERMAARNRRRKRSESKKGSSAERLGLNKSALRKTRVVNDRHFNDIILKEELKRRLDGKLNLSSWKKCWAVLNPEKIEIHKDEKCASIRRVIPLDTIVAIGEGAPLAVQVGVEERDPEDNDDNTFYIEYIGGSVQYRTNSRASMLRWLLCIDSLLNNDQIGLEPESLVIAYLKELYCDDSQDGAVMNATTEWQYNSEKKTYKRVDENGESEYEWNGSKLTHKSGIDYGSGKWSGVYVAWTTSAGEFQAEYTFLFYAELGKLRLVDEDYVEEWEMNEFSLYKQGDKKGKWSIDGSIPLPLVLFTQAMCAGTMRQKKYETSRKVSLAGLPKGSPKVGRRGSERSPRGTRSTRSSSRKRSRSKSRSRKDRDRDTIGSTLAASSPRKSRSKSRSRSPRPSSSSKGRSSGDKSPRLSLGLNSSDPLKNSSRMRNSPRASPRGVSPARKSNKVMKSPRLLSKTHN